MVLVYDTDYYVSAGYVGALAVAIWLIWYCHCADATRKIRPERSAGGQTEFFAKIIKGLTTMYIEQCILRPPQPPPPPHRPRCIDADPLSAAQKSDGGECTKKDGYRRPIAINLKR